MPFSENLMRKNLLKFAAIALASSFSLSAFAQSSGAPGSGPNPFSECGIGAALFPETHWAAVVSNVIWDVGTTAVTSATMSPQTCSGKKVKTALFIRDTYEQLAEEIARGKGEHVAAALEMFQCAPAQRAAAIDEVRADMGKAIAVPGYAEQQHLEQAGQLYNIIEKAASRSCAA